MAPIKINLAVGRSRNRVLFVDAGSDFVEVPLSLLTLPLSALHFCGASTPSFLSNLCDSVSRLRDGGLLQVRASCHRMLLTPSHEYESLLRGFWDTYRRFAKDQPNLQVDGKLCSCWQVMARLVRVYYRASLGDANFVRPKERFVISDDWSIKPASSSVMQSLPHNFSPDAIFRGFEEVQVCVGWAEVVSMLKASLTSDTIFSDVLLSKGTADPTARVTVKPSISQKILATTEDSGSADSSSECKIRLFYDRQEKKVMYAECKHEFVDLLLIFLAYPVGCVINTTGASAAPSKKRKTTGSDLGSSSSFDNLYSSAVDLDAAGFVSGGLPIRTLLNPSLSPFSRYQDDVVKITCHSYHPVLVEDRRYVVDDNLQVHQASAMSVAKHWYMMDKANVVETDVTVGKPKAVALLRAMLTSKTALTDVFIGRLEEPRFHA